MNANEYPERISPVMKQRFLCGIFHSLFMTVLFVSCASHNRKIHEYYSYVNSGQYDQALQALDKNMYLQKERNRFLYNAEIGRVKYLQGQYNESNGYLNDADNLVEDAKKTTGDVVKGTLINPMMKTYAVEDFEKFLLHYYKTLNYCNLGNIEDATVEARRITLDNDLLNDLKKGKTNRYSKDAFSLILQGIIYERSGDINNAFISYRNAVEVYTSQDDLTWYGVTIPDQLKKDVIRTAAWLGFTDQQQYFEKMFNEEYSGDSTAGGSLIIFWEHGRSPVKTEENIVFTLIKNTGGILTYQYKDETYNIPIPVNFGENSDSDIPQVLRIALPQYKIVCPNNVRANIRLNDNCNFTMEPVMDINTVAMEVLRQRRAKDIVDALVRLVTKTAIEAGAKAATKAIAKSGDEKASAAEAVADAVGTAFQGFSFFSEKADTRSWQTLPSGIEYARIPLQKGANKLEVKAKSSSLQKIRINGNGTTQIYSFYTR